MNGPAKHGILIYSNNIKSLASFYIELFSMEIILKTKDLISLGQGSLNIVIHVPPFTIPENNLNSVKLFLTVDNLEKTQRKAEALGGQSLEGVWSNSLFSVANICDSDGNQIQLRAFLKDA